MLTSKESAAALKKVEHDAKLARIIGRLEKASTLKRVVSEKAMKEIEQELGVIAAFTKKAGQASGEMTSAVDGAIHDAKAKLNALMMARSWKLRAGKNAAKLKDGALGVATSSELDKLLKDSESETSKRIIEAARREVEREDPDEPLDLRFDRECDVTQDPLASKVSVKHLGLVEHRFTTEKTGRRRPSAVHRRQRSTSILSPIAAANVKKEKSARESDLKERLRNFVTRHKKSWFQKSALSGTPPSSPKLSPGSPGSPKSGGGGGSKQRSRSPNSRGSDSNSDDREGEEEDDAFEELPGNASNSNMMNAIAAFVKSGAERKERRESAASAASAAAAAKETKSKRRAAQAAHGGQLPPVNTEGPPRNSIIEVFPAHLDQSPLAMPPSKEMRARYRMRAAGQQPTQIMMQQAAPPGSPKSPKSTAPVEVAIGPWCVPWCAWWRVLAMRVIGSCI